MTLADRLAELNITLPAAATPVGSYVPAVQTGNLIFTSGQLPTLDGQLLATGKVGSDVTVEAAAAAAR